MKQANQVDKQVKCHFCGKKHKESASIYIVRDGKHGNYYHSQACADKAAKLRRYSAVGNKPGQEEIVL